MGISFSQIVGVHEQALALRDRRNQVLATNIANADTPGYQARDIDFRTAMAKAASGSASQEGLSTTSPLHMAGPSSADASATGGLAGGDLKYRVPNQPSLDGNTVESQVEQAQFADNALRYQATLTFLGGEFSSLKLAINGS